MSLYLLIPQHYGFYSITTALLTAEFYKSFSYLLTKINLAAKHNSHNELFSRCTKVVAKLVEFFLFGYVLQAFIRVIYGT